MLFKGRITEWNDVRGFGFISPLKGGERIFIHVSAFPAGSRRPTEGEFVSYSVGADERGRRCATQADYAVGHVNRDARIRNRELIADGAAASFLGAVVLLTIVGRLWWPVACVYFVMSIATFFAYKYDKQAAQDSAWRTSEWTLITWGLIGGWPGALVAQYYCRHKTKKVTFQIGYWLSVGLNVFGLVWLIAP